jgi:NADPH2:quinone reductase
LLMNLSPEETRRISAALTAGLESGILSPIVGREFSLSEAARAHEAVLAPGSLGKIVLIP